MQNDLAEPGFLARLGIRLRNATIRRYSSRGAGRYESHRHGRRWQAEDRAFRFFYERIDPRSVLDCPVGTGRWFDVYRGNRATVFGIDISENMLSEAAAKLTATDTIRVQQGDVLDTSKPSPLGTGYDLIVCSRFVYWLRPAELAIMLKRFHATEARFLLAGAKVSLGGSQMNRKDGTGRNWLESIDRFRAQIYRALVKQVYEEDELLRIFRATGWALSEKRLIIETKSVRYLYYLFERH